MLENNVATSFEAPRRRTRVWSVLALYIPLIVLPSALTCVMTYRPLTASRYIDPTGNIRIKDFELNERFQVAINVMNSIAAVLTIPFTSLILAEASIIWLQRKDSNKSRVPLAHFYDIADRVWTDPRRVCFGLVEGQPNNYFLVKSAGFMLLCAVLIPLRQLLVQTENIQILTCNDVPLAAQLCYPYSYVAKANDAQLGLMNILPLWNVKEQVKARLASDTGPEQQTSIWSIGEGNQYVASSGQIGDFYPILGQPNADAYWISAVPNGTTTGVLPQHAMRLNHSVACDRISFDGIPTDCPGSRPLTARFPVNSDLTDLAPDQPADFDARVCVPGSIAESPWDLSRNRQTIVEAICLRLPGPAHSSL